MTVEKRYFFRRSVFVAESHDYTYIYLPYSNKSLINPTDASHFMLNMPIVKFKIGIPRCPACSKDLCRLSHINAIPWRRHTIISVCFAEIGVFTGRMLCVMQGISNKNALVWWLYYQLPWIHMKHFTYMPVLHVLTGRVGSVHNSFSVRMLYTKYSDWKQSKSQMVGDSPHLFLRSEANLYCSLKLHNTFLIDGCTHYHLLLGWGWGETCLLFGANIGLGDRGVFRCLMSLFYYKVHILERPCSLHITSICSISLFQLGSMRAETGSTTYPEQWHVIIYVQHLFVCLRNTVGMR